MNVTEAVGTCLTSIPDFECYLFRMDLRIFHHLCEYIQCKSKREIRMNDMCVWVNDAIDLIMVVMKSRCLLTMFAVWNAYIHTHTCSLLFFHGCKRNITSHFSVNLLLPMLAANTGRRKNNNSTRFRYFRWAMFSFRQSLLCK